MLEIIRGDTTTLTFTLTDSAGAALDITGGTIFFTAKSNITEADVDAEISYDATVAGDGSGGIATVSLTASDTDIAIGGYSYDLQVKTSTGDILSVQAAPLKVVQDVTLRTS